MAKLHALEPQKTLTERQQTMVDILLAHVARVKGGDVAGAAVVSVLADGRMVTNWSGQSDAAMTLLAGAVFRLATEMATMAISAPEGDGGNAG